MKRTYQFTVTDQLETVLTALEHGAEAMDYEAGDSSQSATLRSIAQSLRDHAAVAERVTDHPIRQASSPR
jgi:hypothetical protein